MSTAELKELKKETKRYVDRANERVLRKVFAILEKDADWWDKMPDNVKKDVEESLAQADRGEIMSHAEVKKKYPQWFSK
jgi:predicted transcriptional regulator